MYAVLLLLSVSTAAVVLADSSAVMVVFEESDSTAVLGVEVASVEVSLVDGVDGFSCSAGFTPCAGSSGSW